MTRRSLTNLLVVLSLGCAAQNEADEAADTGADDATTAALEGGPGTADDETAGTTGDVEDPAATWHRDVRPIVEGRCIACHEVGGIAPFPLTSYEEAEPWAESILVAVESGAMPPFPADSACNTYEHDPTLTAEQIEVVRAWVDAGNPEGDPAIVGAALPELGGELPRIDFETGMTAPHVPVAEDVGGLDEHRCFLVDWPRTEDVFVSGYQVVPGNRKAVHHLVMRVIGPDDLAQYEAEDAADASDGWACGSGTGMGAGGALLGGYIPGGKAQLFPEGSGLRIPGGSKVLFNMHYNLLAGDDSPDQTRIQVMAEATVDREVRSTFVLDPSWPIGDNMLIPAGDPDVVHEADFAIPSLVGPVELFGVAMHMHTFATTGELWVTRENGDEECALDIPVWDFDWQMNYRLATPIRLESGDRFGLRCRFDNSAGHQPVIDGEQQPPADLTWGEDTLAEMCMALVYTLPAR